MSTNSPLRLEERDFQAANFSNYTLSILRKIANGEFAGSKIPEGLGIQNELSTGIQNSSEDTRRALDSLYHDLEKVGLVVPRDIEAPRLAAKTLELTPEAQAKAKEILMIHYRGEIAKIEAEMDKVKG